MTSLTRWCVCLVLLVAVCEVSARHATPRLPGKLERLRFAQSSANRVKHALKYGDPLTPQGVGIVLGVGEKYPEREYDPARVAAMPKTTVNFAKKLTKQKEKDALAGAARTCVDADIDVSLNVLRDLAALTGCEVGLFLKVDIADGKKSLCLSQGTELQTTRPTIPAGSTYTFIAHSHPTICTRAVQVQGDQNAATNQVELAVTAGGVVIYYSQGHVYNVQNLPGVITVPIALQPRARPSGELFTPRVIELDTRLKVGTLSDLGSY